MAAKVVSHCGKHRIHTFNIYTHVLVEPHKRHLQCNYFPNYTHTPTYTHILLSLPPLTHANASGLLPHYVISNIKVLQSSLSYSTCVRLAEYCFFSFLQLAWNLVLFFFNNYKMEKNCLFICHLHVIIASSNWMHLLSERQWISNVNVVCVTYAIYLDLVELMEFAFLSSSTSLNFRHQLCYVLCRNGEIDSLLLLSHYKCSRVRHRSLNFRLFDVCRSVNNLCRV